MNKRLFQRCLYEVLVVYAAFFCFSCVSVKQKALEKGYMKILLYNQENQPVKGFDIFCRNEETGLFFTGTTDDEGVLIFPDAFKGSYTISGKKSGYSQLKVKLEFNGYTDMFFCQVCSMKEVLKKTDEAFSRGDYEEGLAYFGELYLKKFTMEHDVYCFYKAYSEYVRGNYESCKNLLKAITKRTNSKIAEACSDLLTLAEEREKKV